MLITRIWISTYKRGLVRKYNVHSTLVGLNYEEYNSWVVSYGIKVNKLNLEVRVVGDLQWFSFRCICFRLGYVLICWNPIQGMVHDRCIHFEHIVQISTILMQPCLPNQDSFFSWYYLGMGFKKERMFSYRRIIYVMPWPLYMRPYQIIQE